MDLLDTGSNILLIILGFGLLIALHELGHFLAARWAGIRADGFAIGMGPVVTSFRKGVGWRLGSCDQVVKARLGKLPIQLSDRELQEHGLGETEYSLRLLPIGGFVKMLGQEDANPGATSTDPRSFNQAPIGKRMVVISAGVVMNIITAVIMFVIAFMVGVRFEAPIIGDVAPGSPAALAVPAGGGDQDPGLLAGDEILRIDDGRTLTFSDVMNESAMSVPDRPLTVEVKREGVAAPLAFEIEPEFDENTNMRMMGIMPASSSVLGSDPVLTPILSNVVGDELAPRLLGARVATVDDTPISDWMQFAAAIDDAKGADVEVGFLPFTGEETADPVTIPLAASPLFETIPVANDGQVERGLLGLVPLVRIEEVPTGSRNEGVFQRGDVILRIADISAPRMNEFRSTIKARPSSELPLMVRRDGVDTRIVASVDANGMVGVLPGYALDIPITAQPVDLVGDAPTPIANLHLLPGTTILEVGGRMIENWSEMRGALIAATGDAADRGQGTTVSLVYELPMESSERMSAEIELDAGQVANLHALGWTPPLPANWFEPMQTTLSAEGNPLEAIAMGFRQTWKMVVLTYLTIDRLIGGSVSVKQLHGPVGIVHIGTKVADRGFMYLVFFLAMISVNLAVLNFLPLPIVDGGLFLFLVYEKIRGRPPSVAFQNAAALIGLVLIGTLFVVTFFNDVMRLTGG